MGELLCLNCKCHIDWCDCPDPEYADEDDLDDEELEYFDKNDDEVITSFWDWMATEDDED